MRFRPMGISRMKSLTVPTLVLSLLAASLAAAHSQNSQNPAPGKPSIARENETSSGKRINPTSYTYQKGERLSLAHGSFDEVADWNRHRLAMPARTITGSTTEITFCSPTSIPVSSSTS